MEKYNKDKYNDYRYDHNLARVFNNVEKTNTNCKICNKQISRLYHDKTMLEDLCTSCTKKALAYHAKCTKY